MIEFDTEDAAIEFIFERLEHSPRLEDSARREFAREFAREFDGLTMESSGVAETSNYHGALAPGRWVIKDDDLKLLEAVLDGLKSAATTSFFVAGTQGPQTISAAAGVLAVVVRLSRQIIKKAARVTPAELEVLVALKANRGGLTLSQLTSKLTEANRNSVEETLAHLGAIAIRDGSVVPLVSKDAKELWRGQRCVSGRGANVNEPPSPARCLAT